jgi:hypothetical protein
MISVDLKGWRSPIAGTIAFLQFALEALWLPIVESCPAGLEATLDDFWPA